MGNFTSVATDSLWRRGSKLIASGTEITVDTFSVTSTCAVKYIMAAYNKAQNKSKMFEVSIANDGGSIKDSVFAKIGASLIIDVTITDAGLVKVKNNNAFEIKLEYAKLVLG